MRFLQYGAGNIGRSFLGALFGRAGYEVIFVEVNPALLQALNRERRYRVVIRDEPFGDAQGKPPGEFWVEGVSAVDGTDDEAVAEEIARADLMATAVGAGALPKIFPVIAKGLERRLSRGGPALDIIIAENLRHAAAAFSVGLREYLPADFPLASYVGLIETSIGKMVPIMPEEVVHREPTLVYAEAYNTLILDRKGFKNPIPEVEGLAPKENVAAYVDCKLFVHNLGHAVCAYLGHLQRPEAKFVWELMGDSEVRGATREAMGESARALIRRYPGEFNEANLGEHIEDLLRRFSNRALGDTVFRIGRDLPRKLSREDRLIGALLLDEETGVPAPLTTLAAAAAFFFHAKDENGQYYPADAAFHAALAARGLETILKEVSGLNPQSPNEARIMKAVLSAYQRLSGSLSQGLKAIPFGRG